MSYGRVAQRSRKDLEPAPCLRSRRWFHESGGLLSRRSRVQISPRPPRFQTAAPIAALTANRAISSGRSQRTGLVPAVILRVSPEEIKVQSDMPQLPYRDGQSWLLRKTEGPAVQVPAVR